MLDWCEVDACKSKAGYAESLPSTTWEQGSIQALEEASTSDEQCPQSSRSTSSDDDEEASQNVAKHQVHDMKPVQQEPPQNGHSILKLGQSQRQRSLSAKSGRVRRQRSRSSASSGFQGQVSTLDSAPLPLQGNTSTGLQSQKQCSKRSRSNLFRRMQELHRTFKDRAMTSESEKEDEQQRLHPNNLNPRVSSANMGHAAELQASTDASISSEVERKDEQPSQPQHRRCTLGYSGGGLRTLMMQQALHEVPRSSGMDNGHNQLPFVLGDAGGDLSSLEELRALSRASALATGEEDDEQQPRLHRSSWCLKDSHAASCGIQWREASNARRTSDIERKHLYLSKCQNLILSRASGALDKLKELRALQKLTAPAEKLSSLVSHLPRFGSGEEENCGEQIETEDELQVCSEECSKTFSNCNNSSSCIQPSSCLVGLARVSSKGEARERDVMDKDVQETRTLEETELRQHEEQAAEASAEQLSDKLDRAERVSRRRSEREAREQAARAVDSQNDNDKGENLLKKNEEQEAKERAEHLARKIERADAEKFVAAFRAKRMARRRSEKEEKAMGSPSM